MTSKLSTPQECIIYTLHLFWSHLGSGAQLSPGLRQSKMGVRGMRCLGGATGDRDPEKYKGRRTELGIMCPFQACDMKLGYSGKA